MKKPKHLPSYFLRKGWCQGSFALNSKGKAVFFMSPHAVEWCLQGAVFAMEDFSAQVKFNMELREQPELYGITVSAWNDEVGRTKKQVIELSQRVERKLGWRK